MTAFGSNLPGTGAMLARLVQLGARCGLTAETTLVHVLDGAPLPLEQDPPSRLDGLNHEPAEAAADEPDEEAPRVGSVGEILLGLNQPAVGEKGQRIADLYGSTALKHPAIAKIVGSTRQSVSFFIREFRAKADPRIVRGDQMRGYANPEPDAPAEAPMTVDGVGDDCSTELRSQSDDILSAGSNGEGRRADLVPDVSPERAEEECAERDAGAQSPEGDFAAIPAPQHGGHVEKGIVRPSSTTEPGSGGVDEREDTADRPAGPGQDLAEAANIQAGDDSVATTEEAGATPPVEPASSAPSTAAGPTASDEVERLWRDTLLSIRQIGVEIGKNGAFVSSVVSQKRKRQRPGILAGDAARIAAEAKRLGLAPPPVPAAAEPEPERAAEPTPSAPRHGPIADDQPDDLVLLQPGQVLAIDRGWIVGPAGSLKGFTLVNTVLAALSGGTESDAQAIARKTAIRSGEAVLAQLAHWKDDLAAIGVRVIRSGAAGIQLARA